MAYFEWSAPDDADPGDREVWRACMPALECNGGIISEDAIAADFQSMKLIEFQRAYLNQWPDRNAADPVIAHEVWSALAAERSALDGRPVFALDASPNRTSAAIAAAGHRPDGVGQVEIVDAAPGTGWVVKRVVELHRKHNPAAWILDPASGAGAWLPGLVKAGIEPIQVTGREMAQACGAFYEDAVENAAFHHLDQPVFNAALSGARKRPLGDAWGWHRRDSDIDISPLVAATLAWHGLAAHNPPERRSAYDDDGELMLV